MAVLSDGGSTLFQYAYDFGLSALGDFKLTLTQGFASPTGSRSVEGAADRLTMAPEASTAALFAAGALAFAGLRRRWT